MCECEWVGVHGWVGVCAYVRGCVCVLTWVGVCVRVYVCVCIPVFCGMLWIHTNLIIRTSTFLQYNLKGLASMEHSNNLGSM